jgi:hypothetical protein
MTENRVIPIEWQARAAAAGITDPQEFWDEFGDLLIEGEVASPTGSKRQSDLPLSYAIGSVGKPVRTARTIDDEYKEHLVSLTDEYTETERVNAAILKLEVANADDRTRLNRYLKLMKTA